MDLPQPVGTIGQWQMQRRIDAGGNADVWRVRNAADGSVGAMKILRNMSSEPYERFRNEVAALAKLGTLDGIVPMIDHWLPDEPKGVKPWYVMPLARTADDFLRGTDARGVVTAFLPLGETLMEIHARGVAHRDIKPQNILALGGRLCLSDFGLVKYPDLSPITPARRDVGAKFTMAPEMRREAAAADGMPADVFSFAKTLWICLTGERLGFDGTYDAASQIGLKRYLGTQYTTVLDHLLSDCTQHDPSARPPMRDVIVRLREWLKVIDDFFLRNAREWKEFANDLFPVRTPSEAVWTDLDGIVDVLGKVAMVPSLNHMFLPNGGGFTLLGAKPAAEAGFIELDVDLTILMKPRKVTFVSVSPHSKWDYLRLEAEEVAATGHYPYQDGDLHEYLSELGPGCYAHPDEYESAVETGRPLPPGSRSITRYLSGSFVFFSTASPYNKDPATYDARHNKMSEEEFRRYLHRNATRISDKGSP